MTREEAIDYLYDIKTDAIYRILSEEKDAIDMAVRSLQAWDKVIEEIDDIDVLLFDDRYEVKEECKYIIKKYLKEVEDES